MHATARPGTSPFSAYSSLPDEEIARELDVSPKTASPWPFIWAIGGTVWLTITVLQVIWLLRWSGTWYEGDWVLSTTGAAVKHAIVFLVAAVAYRIVIALGWPPTPTARLRVLLLNALMVLGILILSEVAEALIAGFVDGQDGAMRAKFGTVFQMFWDLQWFVTVAQRYSIPYALGLCAVVLALVIDRRHREALQAAELGRALANMRLTMLAAQLQPHFLFNSLNAVAELIEEDPRRASAMVLRLGNFLRHALEAGRSPWVKVAIEIDGLQSYLDVQRVRFAETMQIAVDARPESLQLYVPSLILQPLAENAIIHGRAHTASSLEISISVSVAGERLQVHIRNSRPRLSKPLSPAAYGRGLANVALRLRAAYGEAAHLQIGPDPYGDGTLALIDLPARAFPGSQSP